MNKLESALLFLATHPAYASLPNRVLADTGESGKLGASYQTWGRCKMILRGDLVSAFRGQTRAVIVDSKQRRTVWIWKSGGTVKPIKSDTHLAHTRLVLEREGFTRVRSGECEVYTAAVVAKKKRAA